MSVPFTKKWLVHKYWKENKSLAKIATEAGVSDQTIYRYMKKWNIPRRGRTEASKNYFSNNSLTEQQKKHLKNIAEKRKIILPMEEVKKLYLVEKKTTTELAEIFNCSPPTVISRLNEAGVEIRTPNERKSGSLNPLWGRKGALSPRWGKRHSKSTRKMISKKVPRGSKHFKWKPPNERIEPVNKQIRNCSKMKLWKISVFKRDKYSCVQCGKKQGANTQINADHIIPFAEIKRANKIKTLKDALLCEKLWDVSNGRTLCVECHRKTKTWGNKGSK